MKVGLLTYHWVPNFGAQLQTLSTYKFLEKNECNPIIINWIPTDTKNYYNRCVEANQREKHSEFLKKHCSQTEEFSNMNDISSVLKNNGVTHLFIGSDSLFNISKPAYDFQKRRMNYPSSDHSFPNPFWGHGFEDIPHVGLSISSQNAKYTDFKNEVDTIGASLIKFNAITTRDVWTQSLVSYFTHGKTVPEETTDPVFAFNANVSILQTKEEILKKYNLPEKYILFRFSLGRMRAKEEWLKQITGMFHKEGYTCVMLPKLDGGQMLNLDSAIPSPLSPLDWYYVIKYSSGYIGVLMHPIVVSLHNSVPCFSFDHYGTGPHFITKKSSSKIFDILNRANLLQCHFMTRNHLTFPPANKVFRCIMDFPKEKCAEFALAQQERCITNMNNLLQELTK